MQCLSSTVKIKCKRNLGNMGHGSSSKLNFNIQWHKSASPVRFLLLLVDSGCNIVTGQGLCVGPNFRLYPFASFYIISSIVITTSILVRVIISSHLISKFVCLIILFACKPCKEKAAQLEFSSSSLDHKMHVPIESLHNALNPQIWTLACRNGSGTPTLLSSFLGHTPHFSRKRFHSCKWKHYILARASASLPVNF